jgi:hypothetical protein
LEIETKFTFSGTPNYNSYYQLIFLHLGYDYCNLNAMQKLTEKALLLSPPGGLFDMTAVRNLFPNSTEGAHKVLVHRAVRAGEVIRLKPGLFLLQKAYRRTDPHPYVVAALLHAPSHVSLETALSYHGLIPEAVYQTASVTVARSRVGLLDGVLTHRRRGPGANRLLRLPGNPGQRVQPEGPGVPGRAAPVDYHVPAVSVGTPNSCVSSSNCSK